MEGRVLNQAEIMGVLKVEFSRARRYDFPLSCILVQVDRFQHLGDLYGMDVADSIAENVVTTILENSRLSDFLGRVGGRFLLVVPHTDCKGALILAKRFQDKLSLMDFEVSSRKIKVTLSIGLADNSEEDSIFYDSILRKAEASLTKVIREGGDGIEVYAGEG